MDLYFQQKIYIMESKKKLKQSIFISGCGILIKACKVMHYVNKDKTEEVIRSTDGVTSVHGVITSAGGLHPVCTLASAHRS